MANYTGAMHYVTFTVHQWADVFTRPMTVNQSCTKHQLLPFWFAAHTSWTRTTSSTMQEQS